MLYMKGTPSEPQCGFSAQVVRILHTQGGIALNMTHTQGFVNSNYFLLKTQGDVRWSFSP